MKILLTASWCTTCKALKDRLNIDELGCIVIDADTEEGAKVIKEYKIETLPCFINGSKVMQGLGDRENEDIINFYKQEDDFK